MTPAAASPSEQEMTGVDPSLRFNIEPVNGQEAREGGLRLKA